MLLCLRMLREALKQLLDQDELEEVCSAFDQLGNNNN